MSVSVNQHLEISAKLFLIAMQATKCLRSESLLKAGNLSIDINHLFWIG